MLFSDSFYTIVVNDGLHEPYLLLTNSSFTLTLSDSESVWVEIKLNFQIRNDNHAFVVKTPSGMSIVLLSPINLEELSIKFILVCSVQMPAKREIIRPQAETDFLCLHFVSKQDIFFFSGSLSSVGRKLS